jgi:hypothetical protein
MLLYGKCYYIEGFIVRVGGVGVVYIYGKKMFTCMFFLYITFVSFPI